MKLRDMLIGLAAALLLALVLSPFASPWPDGLEKIAGDYGFLHKGGGKPVFAAPISDYAWPGIKSGRTATRIAGVAGTVIAFGLACGIGALARRKKQNLLTRNGGVV